MKSYTDLEQSKKLAEFLPIESADMEYMFWKNDSSKVINVPSVKDDDEPEWPDDYLYGFIPCWSLDALLEIIPSEIFNNKYIINITEGLDNRWLITYDNIDNKRHSFYGLSSSVNNLIDACYEMVIKLHERKLL